MRTRLGVWGGAALVLAAAGFVTAGETEARPLEAIKFRGVISLCAHPNALPFSSKKGDPPGFQIELAAALARELGVGLTVEWVTTRYHPRRADCDIIVGSIAHRQAQSERRVRLSRPYHQSGVALALRPELDHVEGFHDLVNGERVGVLSGSMASFVLDQRGIRTIPFGFEDEMIEALVRGDIEAAAVSPASAGYYNLTHPEAAVRLVHAYEGEPELTWEMAVGMRRADYEVVRAVNEVLERLLADGTVAHIYARYGIEHRPPRRHR